MNIKLGKKIIAASSFVLALGLYGNNASAHFISNATPVPEAGEKAEFGQMEMKDHPEASQVREKAVELGERERGEREDQPASVPESGTLILLGAGLFALTVYSKRNQAKAIFNH